MIFRTDEGYPYSKLVEAYGRLLDSCGDEWKDICEARVIYAMPRDRRAPEMDLMAKKRSLGNATTQYIIRAKMEKTITAEWAWQKQQREACA